MADRSPIEWTQATWNPTTGCDRISTGCDHCYALTLAARLKSMGSTKYQHDGDPRTSGPGFGLTVHRSYPGRHHLGPVPVGGRSQLTGRIHSRKKYFPLPECATSPAS